MHGNIARFQLKIESLSLSFSRESTITLWISRDQGAGVCARLRGVSLEGTELLPGDKDRGLVCVEFLQCVEGRSYSAKSQI